MMRDPHRSGLCRKEARRARRGAAALDFVVMSATRCGGCGLEIARGTAGCRSVFEELVARDFSDVRYFRVHRLMVDTYALQHPDDYCASAKSMAAHLTGVAWLLDRDVSRATGSAALRRWVEAHPDLERPTPPAFRGALTIADVRVAKEPRAYADAVDRWARSTWEAYAPLHAIAHEWIQAALEVPSRPRR